MFSLHEKVVYQGLGVAEVSRIIEKNIGGKVTTFFELKIISNEMTVLVPISNMNGVRKLSSRQELQEAYVLLSNENKSKSLCNASSWTKRNKQYQSEISSGDIKKIVEIYKHLKSMSFHKELSFGEKALLNQSENLLVQEICVVQQIDIEHAVNQLRSFFDADIKATMVKASIKTDLSKLI